MKRLVALGLLALSLTACGGGEGVDNEQYYSDETVTDNTFSFTDEFGRQCTAIVFVRGVALDCDAS